MYYFNIFLAPHLTQVIPSKSLLLGLLEAVAVQLTSGDMPLPCLALILGSLRQVGVIPDGRWQALMYGHLATRLAQVRGARPSCTDTWRHGWRR